MAALASSGSPKSSAISAGDYTSDSGCKLPDQAGWYNFVSFNTVSITDLVAVRLEVMLGSGWQGRMYIDDIELVAE
jgi:hypothetical protein